MTSEYVMTDDEIKEERLLIFARNLISKPEHWTKGAYARDSKGQAVPKEARDRGSFCYCAVGATMQAAVALGLYAAAQGARHRLNRAILETTGSTHLGIIDYNDDHLRTHAEILELFDDAIASIRLVSPASQEKSDG